MDNRSESIRRRDEASAIITSGRVGTAVWYLAWPTIMVTLIQTAYNLINRAFLGKLGPGAADALAAAGIGGQLLMVQFSIMLGLSVGTAALVSRFLGANEHENADEATRQSLFIAVMGGFLTAIPLVVLALPLSRAIGGDKAFVPLAAEYTKIIAYSSVPMFLYMIITTALRSAGDVRIPLVIGAVILAINAVMDYMLIFGIGPFPRMGVVGAAVSTSISRTVGMVLILWYLRRSVLGGALDQLRVHGAWFARILNIGWVAMAQNLLWTMAGTVLIGVLGHLRNGTDAIAALTLGLTIEATCYMPGVAYSTAVTPLVGQNLGAGNPDRAERSAWVAAGQAVLIMTLVAVLFVTIPRQLTQLFTTDASVVFLTVRYLQINAISEPFLALGMVLRGALQGAGDVRVPAWITVITFWLIRLPAVWILSITLQLGAIGAWIAISGSTVLSGILTLLWFRRGNWRTVKV